MNESFNKNRNLESNDDQESKRSKGVLKEKQEDFPDSKAIAKERLQNTKMRAIKHRLENDQPLSGSQKYELTFFLKKFFVHEDLSEYLSMKKKYTYIINGMSLLSLMNVVAVSVTWRGFMRLKTWQKIGVGSSVFLLTHYAGTALVKKEAENMNDQLIDKYKYVIKDMSFEGDRRYA